MADFAKLSTQDLNERKLLSAQLYIQNNLDGDLSLEAVSRAVGASASYLHRFFRARLGETLKAYVDRLRVEKSLYDIRISDLNLLQISLRYGFKNPETYSRVFKRYMGHPPSHFLRDRVRRREGAETLPEEHPGFVVGLRWSADSNFSVTRLATLHLAFRRHRGPYETVPLVAERERSFWRDLEAFVEAQALASPPFIYLGIPHDNPKMTAPEKQQFDACLVVDKPFQPHGQIGYQTIPAGYYAVLTHAGPYATLTESFEDLFYRAYGLQQFAVQSSTVFELLLDTSATSSDEQTWTELYMLLKPKRALL